MGIEVVSSSARLYEVRGSRVSPLGRTPHGGPFPVSYTVPYAVGFAQPASALRTHGLSVQNVLT